jgi:L-rhamnose mutarotase
MKKHVPRIVVMAVPLLLGILIGLASSEAGKAGSARAQGPDSKPAEAKKVQRFGSVIGLRPEKRDYYVKLHANTWPSVLRQIRKSNIRNYSIYLAELEGKLYLFSYFEYVGDDFQADMEKMGEDPETQQWWKETDPCQIQLPDTPEGKWWKSIPEVFHTD